MTNNLNDPYSSLKRDRTSVRTADGTIGLRLGTNDYQYIKTTHGRKDTLQRAFYILLTKLVNELKRNNIGPQYDPDAFERALNGATIILGPRDIDGVYGSTVAIVDPQKPVRNERPGTPGMAQEAPVVHDQSPNVPSGDTNQKSRKGTKSGQGQSRPKRKSV